MSAKKVVKRYSLNDFRAMLLSGLYRAGFNYIEISVRKDEQRFGVIVDIYADGYRLRRYISEAEIHYGDYHYVIIENIVADLAHHVEQDKAENIATDIKQMVAFCKEANSWCRADGIECPFRKQCYNCRKNSVVLEEYTPDLWDEVQMNIAVNYMRAG